MQRYTQNISDTSKINKQILTEIIKLFVVKEKQSRFLEFIESPKRYRDFLDELLNDPRNLREDLVIELPSNQRFAEDFIKKLRELGAKDKVYFVSSNEEDDGKIGRLEEIMNLIYDEGFVYCLDTKLAYYEGHETWRFILCAK